MPGRGPAALDGTSGDGNTADAMAGSPDRVMMSRGLAFLFGAGATLVVITLALPHSHGDAQLALLVPAGLAYVVVAVLLAAPDRIAPSALSAVLAGGTLLVALCVIFSGRAGSAYAFMYVWVALYAAAFLSTRAVVAHVVWLWLAYAAALAIGDDVHPPAAHWLLVAGTTAVAAALIHQLSHELRGRANDLAQVTRLANRIGGSSEVSAQEIGEALCGAVLASADAAGVVLHEVHFDGSTTAVGAAGVTPEVFTREEGATALRGAQDSRTRERVTAEGGRTAAIVEPVLREGRVVGLLAVAWDRPRRLRPRTTAAVPLFAAEAGVALERVAEQSRARERRALELNDAIVQGLVVARYALSEGRVEVGEHAVRQTLVRARALVDEQLQSLHGELAPEPGSLRREGRGIG